MSSRGHLSAVMVMMIMGIIVPKINVNFTRFSHKFFLKNLDFFSIIKIGVVQRALEVWKTHREVQDQDVRRTSLLRSSHDPETWCEVIRVKIIQ